MRRAASAALLAALAAAPLSAQQSVAIELDPAQTRVSFTLGALLHTVRGTFRLSRGTIRYDPAAGRAGGEISLDAASAATGNQGRDERMHREILESARYPEIVFVPERVDGVFNPSGASQFQAQGMLRIHGSEHRVTLPVETTAAAGRLTLRTRFPVPYVAWGMKNPSTLMLRVSDRVNVEIESTVYFGAGESGMPKRRRMARSLLAPS